MCVVPYHKCINFIFISLHPFFKVSKIKFGRKMCVVKVSLKIFVNGHCFDAERNRSREREGEFQKVDGYVDGFARQTVTIAVRKTRIK